MCGIIAVLSRPVTRPIPESAEILAGLDHAVDAAPDVVRVIEALREVDASLRGVAGMHALVGRRELAEEIRRRLAPLDRCADEIETRLEADTAVELIERRELEAALLSDLRDLLWSIRRDRLRIAEAVADLAGRDPSVGAARGYFAIQQALSALDRLEVRGRDSAGIHVFVTGHGLDVRDPEVAALSAGRDCDPLFGSGSLRWAGATMSFVYKAAAEIGELGDNTRVLRTAIAADVLLRRALSNAQAQVSVLGHTRWASVGIVSEPNTHPLNSEEVDSEAVARPYVVAALNGDVDNHADLRVAHGLAIPAQITTDAKVIPALVARQMQSGAESLEAFRRTVNEFEGSVAVGAISAQDPSQLMLALRGSGQGLFVGLGDDCYVVASEPYGVVEETSRYIRMDGESGGEILCLRGELAGEPDGITRLGYDGVVNPVDLDSVVIAEVTTRDIDRGDYPHFLLKEISEAPESFHRTIRGKITEVDGHLMAVVGDRAMPAVVVQRLRSGQITRIRVIGQGTAAVAGRSTAALIEELCDGVLDVRAETATEVSGFQMRLDMSDTLAIAVSQSGTTTDTNRTVDLLRSRGALVIGIVNRRGSDLVDKSDGVLYTSDGRDVEMSVASTKAFYAQVAAGALLACAISECAGHGSQLRRHRLLESLREMPDALRTVLETRPEIAEVAQRYAPSRRYWAVVGNGPNRVAAEEVRIKLSELCYKSIACDATEDKKHIDLSSEPLILVCAAGLQGSTADDVAKETAIFRAHKAAPIVIADRGDLRYSSVATLEVPAVDPALGFVLSAMVGHLFGYEAARAIDATARPLREAREAIERAVTNHSDPDDVLEEVASSLASMIHTFHEILGAGDYDGQLEARTAIRLVEVLRDLGCDRPVEEYQRRTGKVGSPAALLDELLARLTAAIEELTRPIDAIKHQAKTVTVGISRSDEGVLDSVLVQAALTAGAGRDVLSYRSLKVLADLDPAVVEVTGFIRYRVEGGHIEVIDRGGIALDLQSRVERSNVLVGTKRRVADEREVLVAKGRSDQRTVVLIPEVKGGECTGITLLHLRFRDRVEAGVMRSVLQGYDRRYDRLVDWVTETEGSFDDARLGEVPVADLLIRPISEMADLWLRQ
jgi:glucosamine--fructose-6-phosphate aminotransferase (isomerizing)